MRLLHTSDWHLGQVLHNYERSYEHACFLDWLLDTLVAEQVDALVIAGDVFDSSNPPAAAQHQLYRFLRDASARMPQLDIVIIAGNHDSPGRLEAPAPLLESHRTTVIGNVLRDAAGQIDLARMLVPLHGPDGAVEAWCLAVPFLRPGDVARPAAPEDGAPAIDADPYLAGIGLLYQHMLALALEKRAPGQAIVALGHCHMAAGQASLESERRIVIGGSEAVPESVFDPVIAYAALGHLHLAQRVARKDNRRYCGSPLPLSFAEVDYQHQVLLVDLAGDAMPAIRTLPVPRAVPLLRVPAQPAPLAEVLAALEALAPPPAPDLATSSATPLFRMMLATKRPSASHGSTRISSTRIRTAIPATGRRWTSFGITPRGA